MLSQSIHLTKTSISQNAIRPKIRAFIAWFDPHSEYIEAFKGGYCHGLAILAGFGQYLEAKQVNGGYNWRWFVNTLRLWRDWDGKLPSLDKDQSHDMFCFINLLEQFQNANKYFNVGQGYLDAILEDTELRRPLLEYTVAGLFTLNNFLQPISHKTKDGSRHTCLIDEILKYPHRIILLSRGGHTLLLFNFGKTVSIYNSNRKYDRVFFDIENKRSILEEIFASYHYDYATPSSLGFRVFTMEGKRAEYIPQQKFLEVIKPPLFRQLDADNIRFGLLMATRINSLECAEYYLSHGESPNRESKNKFTPLYSAISKGYLAFIQLLLKFDADINHICGDGYSPLMLAAYKGEIGIVKILLEYGNNATKENLTIALKHLQTDALRLELLQKLAPIKLQTMVSKKKQVLSSFTECHAGKSNFYKRNVTLLFKPIKTAKAQAATELLEIRYTLHRVPSSS